MNASPTLAIALVVVLTSTDARAASPDAGLPIAAVKGRLQGAAERLAKAVRRIETDPPSTADLDAAWAAVDVLKDAIDAGAAYEAADLEYAKAALAARKQLRTQRDYVEERRAKVYLFNHRRVIDAAMATLNDRAGRTGGKGASPRDFDEARVAAAELRKALDQARPFAKQDAAFAGYLTEADATATRHEKTIEDRWTLREVNAHRARVEGSRQALSVAIAALARSGGDAQFEAADLAATRLSKLLDEGKVFEPRDKAYAAVAESARADVVEAKKRMEQLLGTTALERLKSEIEPAYKDLAGALRAIRVRKPAEERLAEARTAAIVVRKLVEKFQPQASRSKPFGEYLSQVTATLVDVESELLRRNLDSARAEVVRAQRSIERRSPTDEQFAELNTAITILEKTLETVPRPPPAVASLVVDARALLRDARSTAARRRAEVDVQRHRAKVQETKRSTEAVVQKIQPADAGEAQLQEADEAVKQLRTVLEEGAPFIKKDRDYAQYDSDVKQRIAVLADRIEKRRIALAARAAKSKLAETMAGGRSKLEAATRPESTEADLEAASKSVAALAQALEGNEALERQDMGYAMNAERARNELMRQTEALELAKQASMARRQTGNVLAAGELAARAAAGARDLRTQKKHYATAMSQFRSCEENGTQLLKESPTLAKLVTPVEERRLPLEEVVALCSERVKATEQPLRQVSFLVAFEDGPKRAFENARALRARSKRAEAIGQFNECIISAGRVQYDFRELKDHKFAVAGANLTLAEMVKTCAAERDALAPKK